jgi:hypothetical protein
MLPALPAVAASQESKEEGGATLNTEAITSSTAECFVHNHKTELRRYQLQNYD